SPPSFLTNGRTILPTESGTTLLPYQVTIAGLIVLVMVLGVLVMRRGKPPYQTQGYAQFRKEHPP
ncbi:MAG: hypothetical protein ACE5HJ_08205, partial [Thermoplasmata archaeon]